MRRRRARERVSAQGRVPRLRRRRSEPPLEQILLPVPSALGKGVLVFPTLDRRAVIAGPTAREREDKRDWSVEADAAELILAKAQAHVPGARASSQPIGAYAGLRPAGRDANYVIERSRTLPALDPRRRDPLHRTVGVAGDRRARRRDAHRRGRDRARPGARAAGARAAGFAGSLVGARRAPARDVGLAAGGAMSSGLLLGIDEGTTAVKAALFDDQLRAVAEARRAGPRLASAPRLGRAEPRADPAGRRGRGRGGARARRPPRGPRRGPRPPGRVRARVGRGAAAARSRRWSCGRTSARNPCSPTSIHGAVGALRPAARPLLLGRQARMATRQRRWRAERSRCGLAAPGHGRRVPHRPSRRPLRHRSVDGFAHAAAGCGRARLGRRAAGGRSGCGASGCRRSVRHSARWASSGTAAGR